MLMRNASKRVTVISDFKTPAGSPLHDVLEPRFDGVSTKLVSTGKENIQDKINAYAPFCDLTYMLNRLAIGDTSVINPRSPMYGNFAGMPNNINDALNYFSNAEKQFNKLDLETRKKFNNDWKIWISALNNSKPVDKKPEPKEGETE